MDAAASRSMIAPEADPWDAELNTTPHRVDFLSIIPLVAIVAILALVGALMWAVNRSAADRARTKLATDALWVEQTLRFQLSVDEDMLVRLALDEAGGTPADTLDARARVHIASNPEVLSIAWYTETGQAVRALTGQAPALDSKLLQRATLADPLSLRPIYGDSASGHVTMIVRSHKSGHVIAASISLPLLLERHIPWWIAEQYAIQLSDHSGSPVAARGLLSNSQGNVAHYIGFDPPLAGTVLKIAPFAKSENVSNTMLLATIAGLSLFAILSLVVLFRNSKIRRGAERRLKNEIAFRRSVEDSLTVGLRAKDNQGKIIYVNSAFCNLIGWSKQELVGHNPPMPYWSQERLEETLSRQATLATTGAHQKSFETRFRHRDGHEIDVLVYEAPLIDANGTHRGWMGSVIDITEAKRAARTARIQEEQIAHTGRLVTLGEMASTLAHELNQPLAAIASYAAGSLNMISSGTTDPKLLASTFQKLSGQSIRAGQTIRRIQDLVKKRQPHFETVDLAEVIEETVAFLSAAAREHRVKVNMQLKNAPVVQADRILLEQVLINLMRNGMEAMTEINNAGRRVLTIRLQTSTAGGAEIEVADRGSGIDANIADKLFEAFTTTKAQGMGMGLSICRSIVEVHRGHLSHHPNKEGGTIFVLSLPKPPHGLLQAVQ